MNKTTRNIVTAAVIGALYAVLTMVLAPISYGPVQCRISEVLCILPFFMPSTTWGLFFGCAIAGLNPIKNFGAFAVFAGEVALGEAAVMFIAGLPLLSWLPKQKFFTDYIDKA